MPEGLWVWLAIGSGSAVGGLVRHAVTDAVSREIGSGFPWGTLVVNVTGSAAIGAVAVFALGPPPWSPSLRHAVMTGVLGGFTTFSSFSLQTVALLEQGHGVAAGTYVLSSVVLCVGACWLSYVGTAALLR